MEKLFQQLNIYINPQNLSETQSETKQEYIFEIQISDLILKKINQFSILIINFGGFLKNILF